MTGDPREAARAAEAKATLERLKRDNESVLGSSMGRAADHFAAKDAPPDDKVELWGRRIGRSLSLIAVILLAFWLGHQLKIW
ncbi:MAG: hypothetical protein ACK4VM_14925 [Bosea sp. (in: a-proteobacteria)]